MTHPTDDSLKPCPFCGSQPEPAPYVLKCVNAYCEAQPSVSGGNDDECATAWNKRALLVEQARTEPHKAEDAPSDAELLDWLIATGRYVNHDIDGYRLCEPDDGESINGPFDDGREAIRRDIARERKA